MREPFIYTLLGHLVACVSHRRQSAVRMFVYFHIRSAAWFDSDLFKTNVAAVSRFFVEGLGPLESFSWASSAVAILMTFSYFLYEDERRRQKDL